MHMILGARKIKTIAVATDLSEKSAFILEKAAKLAELTQSKLTILHVIQKKTSDKFIDKLLAEHLPRSLWLSTEEYLENLLQEKIYGLASYKLDINKALIYEGKPAKKILQYVRKNKVDLLIMGAHGDLSVREYFVGTTAEHIANKIACPTLIIKNKIDKFPSKILVATDFSDASKNALNFLIQLFPNSKPQLIHVGDYEYQDLLEREKKEERISKDKLVKIKKAIYLYLDAKMKKFIKGYSNKLAKRPYYILMGNAGEVIVNEAHKKNKDLIVMGTQGHGRLHYLFLGSVANSVLIETDTDILLVPPKK